MTQPFIIPSDVLERHNWLMLTARLTGKSTELFRDALEAFDDESRTPENRFEAVVDNISGAVMANQVVENKELWAPMGTLLLQAVSFADEFMDTRSSAFGETLLSDAATILARLSEGDKPYAQLRKLVDRALH